MVQTRFDVPAWLQEAIDRLCHHYAKLYGVAPGEVLNPPRRSQRRARARASLIIWLRDNVLVYGQPPIYEQKSEVPEDDRENWDPLSFPKIAFLVNLDQTSVAKAYRVHKNRLFSQADRFTRWPEAERTLLNGAAQRCHLRSTGCCA